MPSECSASGRSPSTQQLQQWCTGAHPMLSFYSLPDLPGMQALPCPALNLLSCWQVPLVAVRERLLHQGRLGRRPQHRAAVHRRAAQLCAAVRVPPGATLQVLHPKTLCLHLHACTPTAHALTLDLHGCQQHWPGSLRGGFHACSAYELSAPDTSTGVPSGMVADMLQARYILGMLHVAGFTMPFPCPC